MEKCGLAVWPASGIMSTMQSWDYDVAVIGGAFSGASLALLLRRAQPSLRVLIIERASEFDRKVGESTSEVAAAFLTRVLRVGSYLNREHIAKQGLRMWFMADAETPVDQCSEIGAYQQSRLPAFQVDRSRLDEHLLAMAVAEGCELWRPARIRKVALKEGGDQEMEVTVGEETRSVRARWMADASGKAAFLARNLGHWRRLEGHETNSMWARFTGVADLDGPEVARNYPAFAAAVRTSRSCATNHLMGRGWWCWIIPLADGDFSFGLTYDRRLFEPPEGPDIAARLLAHARSHPVGRLLFERARVVGTDMRAYAHLPYRTEQMCGDGWISVGDAAGFMDPLYSQGLDYCAHTVFAAHRLVLKGLAGEPMTQPIAALNQLFTVSYERWYRSIYHGKYAYLGDAQLMKAAFLLDLSCYFIGPVRLVYEDPETEFALLPYAGPAGALFARFMAFYNRRLTVLAERRWQAGTYGRHNTQRRFLLQSGFVAKLMPMFKLLRQGIWIWLTAELQNLFTWPRRKRDSQGDTRTYRQELEPAVLP